jgi:NAD(P)-dependent dehydrogenase (short-subunit alcohol dehydrogenase family)
MTEPITFDGRVAIITGAGGGLGREYALELARRGAQIVVNDLGGAMDGTGASTSAADVVVDEINGSGGEAVPNYDSVATREGGQSIVDAALDAFGTVDIVINNAGILRDKSFANMTLDEVDAVLGVHLHGAFHVSHPAFKVMKERGYGRFIHASSAAGIFGNFGQANYGAAKSGLVGLSNVLAIEGAKYNIKSNAIAPIARTRMTEDILGPMIEMVDPKQVVPMVVYLASEESQLTHEIFSVGGGRYARAFMAVNRGWFAGAGAVPTVEELADNLDLVRDVSDYVIPANLTEEIGLIGEMLAD